MALEGAVRHLLEEVKYRHKFPPREAAAKAKSDLAVRGLARSGALLQEVSRVYLDVVRAVLDEFSNAVMTKRVALGLSSQAEVRAVVASAHEEMFNHARGGVLDEVSGAGDYQGLAAGIVDQERTPVWQHLERVIELQKLDESATVTPKEREQKFGILLSPGQAVKDFAEWKAEAEKWGNPMTVLFVDLDNFKTLNERLTHTKVDQTILPEAQTLLAKLVQGRGAAYRQGGDEFVVILPNLEPREADTFAGKVRAMFESHPFEVDGQPETVTVSIGVALWPDHGATYPEVLESANRAEAEAKKARNAVRMA